LKEEKQLNFHGNVRSSFFQLTVSGSLRKEEDSMCEGVVSSFREKKK
jgi:hypothetical protein